MLAVFVPVLVVAVDYATYVAASVAREAGLFLVDQREQFLANVDIHPDDLPRMQSTLRKHFDGCADPERALDELIAR